jgi:hypothetical protein
MDLHEGLTRSIASADNFLTRLSALDAAARERIDRTAFGNPKHTGALMMTADEITTLRAKDKDDRLAQFLVDAERRIADLHLPKDHESLTKAAVRALVVQHLPGREGPTRDLYAPFEPVIPIGSLA